MNPRIVLAALVCWVAGCDRAPHSTTAPLPTPPTAVEPAAPTSTPAPPVAAVAPEPDPRLPAALALHKEAKLAEARALLQQIVAGSNATEQAFVALSDVNTQVIFSQAPAPEKIDHTIIAGDALGKLARKYGTTIALLKKSNNLTSDIIRIGDRLRIYQPQFAVTVSKSASTLTLTDRGNFFKRYRVGTGQHSKTPTGEFKITTRVENPPWHRGDGKVIPYGDPENILGTHWLGLDLRGYGLHGTWETNSIGKQASAGCVRLLNGDIAELYTLLPEGTPVIIHD